VFVKDKKKIGAPSKFWTHLFKDPNQYKQQCRINWGIVFLTHYKLDRWIDEDEDNKPYRRPNFAFGEPVGEHLCGPFSDYTASRGDFTPEDVETDGNVSDDDEPSIGFLCLCIN
jgi:hypothetical protein